MSRFKCIISILLIIQIIFVAAIYAVKPWVGIYFNRTASLKHFFFVVHKNSFYTKGDLIAYRWSGGATYPKGVVFIKPIVGVAGDRVIQRGRHFWVNDSYIGIAKPLTKAGIAVAPAKPGVIKKDEYFVATPHLDSLDSRYELSGNIKREDIIGRAYAIF